MNILTAAGSDYTQLKVKAAELEEAFAKMGADKDHNSQIARAVYLSEAHNYFLSLRSPLVIDNEGHMYNPVNELTKDVEVENNIYYKNFSFAEYGQRTRQFLDEAHSAI